MSFSSSKIGGTRRTFIRSLILSIIASIAIPLSPGQAEAVGERARSAVKSAFDSLHGSGNASAAEAQDFALRPTEDLSRNADKVTHFRLYPRRLKLYVGEAYTLTAIPLGRGKEIVDGVATAWETRQSDVASVSSWGEVTAVAAGRTQLMVRAGTAHANVFVEVIAGARPRQTDEEWDAEHDGDDRDSEAIAASPSTPVINDDETLISQPRFAFENGLSHQSLKQLARPAMLRRSASMTPKAAKVAGSPAPARSPAPPLGYVIDGDGGDTFALDAVKFNNELGTTRFTPQETAQGKKHNLGSYDYFFSVPVLALGGRGTGINLAMNYNSRVWNKDGSVMTFNYNKGWPAAGWALGYGRIIRNYNNTASGDQTGFGSANRPGDFLLLQPDGSRVHLAQTYDTVSSWWKHDSTDGLFLHFNDQNGKLKYPDGTLIKYDFVNNRLVPTSIESRNGDLITIVYRIKTSTFRYRWAIDTIKDTLGRVIQFHYYDDKDALGNIIPEYAADELNGRPAAALAAITATDFGGASTRTLVRINYQNITMAYTFSSSLSVDSGAPVNGTQLGVVRRIYYPSNGRGYVFANYSGYGMAKKISSRIGMTAASDGTEVAYTDYTYADTGTLDDSPQFTARNEWWQGKTDANGAPDNSPTVYGYSRTLGSGTEIDTVSYWPAANLDIVTTTDNSDPSSLTYGKVLSVVRKQHTAPGNVFNQTDYTYTFPSDGGAQIGSVVTFIDTWNGLNQRTKIAYTYGSYGRITNIYEYGLKEGGAFNVRRRTNYSYINDSTLTGANMIQLIKNIEVYDALNNNNDADDVLKSKTFLTYDDYGIRGGMETYGLSAATYPVNHDAAYDQNKTARGNVTGMQTYSQISPAISTIRYMKYDIFGNTVQSDISCCQTRNFTFNSSNYYSQPVSVTNGTPGVAPFLTTNYQYDFSTGLVTQTTDPNNLSTSFTYDAAWRVKQVTAPSGAITTAGYDKDANGNDLMVYAEQASYTENGTSKVLTDRSWMDGAGHVLRTGSGAGASPSSYDLTATVYDSLGRVAKQSNPYAGDSSGNGTASYWTVNVYDEVSRIKQVTLPDNQTMTTLYSGVTTTVTDQVGRKRQSDADGLGRLVKVTEQNPATGLLDATNYLTTYSYDALDNLTQVNQGNQTRTFVYDALSRLTSQTTPETGTISFAYTESGDLLKRTDARGVETHYKYDSLNRPTQVWYTGAGGNDAGTVRPALPANVTATADATISYNNYTTPQPGNGLINQIIDQAGSETYSYDTIGRLAAKTRVIDARSYQTQYLYNTVNQVTTLVYPSGKRVRTNRDNRGRMSGLDKVDNVGNVLSQYMTSVGYSTSGQTTSVSLANGVNETYGYDPQRMQMTSQLAAKGANTLLSLTYGYSASAGASGANTTAGNGGQLVSITGTVNGQARGQSFTYDNLGRLLTANGWSLWARRYGYDRWGNRTGMWDAVSGGSQLQSIAIATTGSLTNNRIATVNGTLYSYDASGNVTGDGGHIYGYDAEGRQASVDSGATSTNVYDSHNWRVKKISAGVTTHYVWESGQVIAEYNGGTGALISEYIYAGSRMLARDQGGALRYYHQDRLSTRLITDGSGAVVGAEDHLPFGEEAGTVGENEKHRFTNYERDSESGTDYAMNRQHQYANGRFMQPDPVAGAAMNPQSFNRYAYALNDPINLSDPLGLYEACVHEAMTEYLVKESRLSRDSRLAQELAHYAGDGPGGADSAEFAATNLGNNALNVFNIGGTMLGIHFASDSTLEKRKATFFNDIKNGSLQQAGFTLHALEDAHGAHRGYRGVLAHIGLGHAIPNVLQDVVGLGHSPDRIIGTDTKADDGKFVNVSNEIYQFLTGNRNLQLTPKQFGDLIQAIIDNCSKKGANLNKFKISRPRTVGGGGGFGGGGFFGGGFGYPWWWYSMWGFADWVGSIGLREETRIVILPGGEFADED